MDVYHYFQSKSPSPKGQKEEELDVFYLPQMNKKCDNDKRELSMSPSRKYIQVKGSHSYSKKLFHKSSGTKKHTSPTQDAN